MTAGSGWSATPRHATSSPAWTARSARDSATFVEVRRLAAELQNGLLALLFETSLAPAVREYAIFCECASYDQTGLIACIHGCRRGQRADCRLPFALLVGFVLDQQVTVQKAFSGPLAIKERLGAFDAATLADADLDTVFREKPSVHRYPGGWPSGSKISPSSSATTTTATPRVWTEANNAAELRANLAALPGSPR